MGIYDNGSIFGIKMYNFNDDISNILFEKIYNEIMSDEEKKKVYLFYTELSKLNNDIHFQYYTGCSTTYSKGNFSMWYPMSLNTFLEKFGI
jgi:hypothetical protein